MAPILVLLILVTIVTGLTVQNSDEDRSGSGSGDDYDDELSGLEDTTTVVATSIGLNATDENFFTPPPSYPPEAYLPPEGEAAPLVNTEDGFYIRSDGSGDSDDEDGLQEVDLLFKVFDITRPTE
nr:protein E30 [Elephant endotheliotropic herpesvirus 1A]UVZ34479.1 protein E30 [Elephant endotheliotropic herpesvirus 1A]UVZ34503.1 protein E30 [Elephant endotheliotropic herpesvirus 1A]